MKNFEIPPLEKILADEGRKAMCKDMVVVEHFEKILQKRNIRWRRRFERPHLAQTDACCRFDQVGHFILDLLVNKGAVFQRAKSLMRVIYRNVRIHGYDKAGFPDPKTRFDLRFFIPITK